MHCAYSRLQVGSVDEQGGRPLIRVSWTLMCKPLAELEAEAGMCEAAGLAGVWWPDYQGAGGMPAAQIRESISAAGSIRSTLQGVL